ncbi:hypothetical protein ACM43_05220 [Bradyrhizobium sp. CCBAU 45321]|nr:hypothetical protein [Bradyrhizobium sp. CCBAU 45321]
MREFRIILDGRVVQTKQLTGVDFADVFEEKFVQQGRWLNFLVEDDRGLISSVRPFFVNAEPYTGTLRVISVGVDRFNNGRLDNTPVVDLRYAESDSKRFLAAIKDSLAPSYQRFESKSILGAVRPNQLLTAIRETAEATAPSDTLVVFIASHGMSSSGEFSLLLPGGSKGGPVETLSFQRIAEMLGHAKGRVFVFLDACHSADAGQDSAAELLAARNNGDITIIAASKGRQSSLESQDWRGGIFTTSLIDALKASVATQSRRDQSDDIDDLYASIRRRVSQSTSFRQTPWLRRSSYMGIQSLN